MKLFFLIFKITHRKLKKKKKKDCRSHTDNSAVRGEPELVPPLLGCGNTCTYNIAVTSIFALRTGSADSQTRALARIWAKPAHTVPVTLVGKPSARL